MQQTIKWEQRGDSLHLTSQLPTEIDNFEHWAYALASTYQWQIVSVEQGADRGQLHFQVGQFDYLLHFESLCEAIWIEPMNSQSAGKIGNLIIELE